MSISIHHIINLSSLILGDEIKSVIVENIGKMADKMVADVLRESLQKSGSQTIAATVE
jgi:hypothetical protein